MSFVIIYTKQAQKDAKKLSASHLARATIKLIDLLKDNPLAMPHTKHSLVICRALILAGSIYSTA